MMKNTMLLIMAICSPAFSQTADGLSLVFSRNNNTYNWESRYNRRFETKRFSAGITLDGYSILIKKPDKRWQENLAAGIQGRYKLLDNLHISPSISYSRAALQDRLIYSSDLKIAVPYSGLGFIRAEPFVGNMWRKNVDPTKEIINRGPSFGLQTDLRKITVKGYPLQFSASYSSFAIDKIPYSQFQAAVGGERTWGNGDTLQWNLENFDGVKKYYSGTQAGETLVRQVKVERGAKWLSKTAAGRLFVIRVAAGAVRSNYYYDNANPNPLLSESDNFSESYNYSIQVEKSWRSRIFIQAAYRWRSDKQDFLGNLLDLWSELGEVLLKAGFSVTSKDSVGFDCVFGVTSFYGLHGPTINERDQRTTIMNIRFKRVFNRHFWGELRTGYSLFHQLYINSISSANNNRNETYLLGSRFGWNVCRPVRLIEDFEIQTNYISYDYDRLTINTRNRIFRRASWNTGVEIRFSPSLIIKPGYLYRYEDYGKLFWNENNWQQATGWDRRYHRIEAKMEYIPVPWLKIEPQYIWESKNDYNYVFAPSDSGPGNVLRQFAGRDLKQTAALAAVWKIDAEQDLTVSYNRRVWTAPGRNRDIGDFLNVAVRYIF